MTAADAAAEYVDAIPLWIDVAATIAAFRRRFLFTQWYPAGVRRRVGLAGGSEKGNEARARSAVITGSPTVF